MAISKVVYGTKVLVDLTSDTVDAAHLAEGYTAHGANGDAISGSLDPDKTALDFLAGKELPQEVLDKVEVLGDYAFVVNKADTLKFPNLKRCSLFAFWNDKVRRVSIPSAVDLGWGPFNNAVKLQTVVVGTKNDSVCSVDGMGSGVENTVKFYVPDALVDAYKADKKWAYIASQIYPVSELPEADKDLLI